MCRAVTYVVKPNKCFIASYTRTNDRLLLLLFVVGICLLEPWHTESGNNIPHTPFPFSHFLLGCVERVQSMSHGA